MKKIIATTTEMEFEIELHESICTPEYLVELSQTIREVEDVDALTELIAEQLCRRPYPHFIEGVGRADFKGVSGPTAEVPVLFRNTYESTECELLDI